MRLITFFSIFYMLLSCSSLHRSQAKESILLISIDGYRHDYTKYYTPKFLTKFSQRNAQLKSLIPSYPTKTFPNHLSIVTGRYPINHGIVANHFYAPDLKRQYSLRDRASVINTDFYLSKPIWSLAEQQGIRTATYFWPGSEAEISGNRPTYWMKYDHNRNHLDRINKVIEWFKLPEDKRPKFVTLYFHDVDSAGHKYGPLSVQTKEAIKKVDQSIEKLLTELNKLNLPINTIIVSDHGMADLKEQKHEVIAKSIKQQELIDDFIVIGKGPIVQLYKSPSLELEETIKGVVKKLNQGAKNYQCYSRESFPTVYNFNTHSRAGDIICRANKDWSISVQEEMKIPQGNHGWSQFTGKDMHGIFYAGGPAFKKGITLESQENINIYPVLAKILDLKIDHAIDGDIEKMEKLLK